MATAGHAFEPRRSPRTSYADFLNSESSWRLLARAGERPIGLCVAVRIPKLDPRIGFLFVDEILVVQARRPRCVRKKLIEHAVRLARVCLLTHRTNTAAQRFYATLGFARNETLFFERSFDQDADRI